MDKEKVRFWGLCCASMKRYRKRIMNRFRVTMAALDTAEYDRLLATESSYSGLGLQQPDSTNNCGEDGLHFQQLQQPFFSEKLRNVSLYVERDGSTYLLCTLTYGKVWQMNLDLFFDADEEITFFIKGCGAIHLSGYTFLGSNMTESSSPLIPHVIKELQQSHPKMDTPSFWKFAKEFMNKVRNGEICDCDSDGDDSISPGPLKRKSNDKFSQHKKTKRSSFVQKPTEEDAFSEDIDCAENTEAEPMDAVNQSKGNLGIVERNRNAEILRHCENDVLGEPMGADKSSCSVYLDLMSRSSEKLITYPSPQASDNVTITVSDLMCLDPSNLLNDSIIDFYVKYIYYDRLTDDLRDKTHICNSFFTKHLDRLSVDQTWRWTKNVDIFSKQYIAIPVHKHNHWYLIIICLPGEIESISQNSDSITTGISGDESNNHDTVQINEKSTKKLDQEKSKHSLTQLPCILIFDSLEGSSYYETETRLLRSWLQMEWNHKRKTNVTFSAQTVPAFSIKCPQQTNCSDCGVYLLQCLENFFDDPFQFNGDLLPDLSDWFPEERIIRKREEIKRLIHALKNIDLETTAPLKNLKISVETSEIKKKKPKSMSATVTGRNAAKNFRIRHCNEILNKLEFEDIKTGNGPPARKGKIVCVRYTGYLEDGTVFESNHSETKKFSFKLGEKASHKGLDDAIEGMKVGGKRKLKIPSSLFSGLRKHGEMTSTYFLDYYFDLEAVL